MMSGTEVNTSSAWAERTLAVLLLPFAFIVMFGGGAGLVWLWQDYRAQFWIGSCILGVVFVALSAASSAVDRRRRRNQWLADESGAGDGFQYADDDAEPADDQNDRDLLLDVLARVESMQQNLGVLMGELGAEQQRVNSGRHAGPITVDIRDAFNDFDTDFDTDFDADFDDDYDSDDDYADIDTRDHTGTSGDVDDADGRRALNGLNDLDVETDDNAEDTNHLGGDDAFLDDELGDGGSPGEPGSAAQDPDSHRNPERRMRRLVRDRTGRQQWDALPAPREPVQVIELPRDGDAGSHPDSDDEDDDDYFGDDTLLDGEKASPENTFDDQTDDAGAGSRPEPPSRTDDDPREGGRRRRDAR